MKFLNGCTTKSGIWSACCSVFLSASLIFGCIAAPASAYADGEGDSTAEAVEAVEAQPEQTLEAQVQATQTQNTQTTQTVTVNTTPRKYSQSLITQNFIAQIAPRATVIANEHGLYPSVMIAQAILESASGTSNLSSKYHNLFGIKGSYQGKSVTLETQEDDGQGNMTTIKAAFRAYSNVYESLEDYANLLTVDSATLYAGATRAQAATYVDACNFLQGKYATSSSYSVNLQSMILTYDLTKYDQAADYEFETDYEMQVTNDAGEGVTYAAGEQMFDALGEALTDADGNPVYAAGGEAKMELRDLDDLCIEATNWVGQNFDESDAAAEFTQSSSSSSSFEFTLAFLTSAKSQTIEGFDFAAYCYKKVFGIDMPATYDNQITVGKEVDTENDSLHVGDMLFFSNNGSSDISSVGLYIDENYCLKVSSKGTIEVTRYSTSNLVSVRRIIQTCPIGTRAAKAAELEAQQAEASARSGEAIGEVVRNLTVQRMELEAILQD